MADGGTGNAGAGVELAPEYKGRIEIDKAQMYTLHIYNRIAEHSQIVLLWAMAV